jgi:hypothetical protein
MTILVPRGAEAMAVNRARPAYRVVAIAPGQAGVDSLPSFALGEIVLVLGVCGALRERRAGDVVVYRKLVGDDVPIPALDVVLTNALAAQLATHSITAFSAVASTTDHVITMRTERYIFSERWGADVVDMEAIHLARALTERGLRCAMVRVVSDDTRRDLPSLEAAIRPDGRVDGLRITLAFARAPITAVRFVCDVRTALSRLTEVARALDDIALNHIF